MASSLLESFPNWGGGGVDTFENFEIDPSISGFVGEVVLLENSSVISVRWTRTYL